MRTTANDEIGQINGKRFSKFSSKSYQNLVYKSTKKANAVEEKIDNNSENVNADAQLLLKLPVIWNKKPKFKKGTINWEGELQLPNNLDNSQMLKSKYRSSGLGRQKQFGYGQSRCSRKQEVLFNIEKTAKMKEERIWQNRF